MTIKIERIAERLYLTVGADRYELSDDDARLMLYELQSLALSRLGRE